jgi:nucleoside phosphorylase
MRGRLVTAADPVLTPEARRDLRLRSSALAVDMESAVAAQLCQESGMPFSCLRAVSDACHTPFPDALVHALQGERVHAGRLLRAVLRRPLLLRDLARLARQSRVAAAALAVGLTQLVGTTDD